MLVKEGEGHPMYMGLWSIRDLTAQSSSVFDVDYRASWILLELKKNPALEKNPNVFVLPCIKIPPPISMKHWMYLVL